MGWSGSSAIYDYLREFKGIYAIRGESSAFEGSGGFRAFIAASGSVEACRRQMIRFFFMSMLGFLPMTTSSCFKEQKTARTNSMNPKSAARYAENSADVVRAMVRLLHGIAADPSGVAANLRILCDTIADRMVAYMAPPNRVILLNNCIHVQNIALARYMSNTRILCCFRDPRTNYVALRRESPGFSKTAKQFIRSTRNIRAGFDASLDASLRQDMAAIGTHVEAVAFENFVVSVHERRRISDEIGLDPSASNRFAHFKPWDSFRNTQLHLDFEAQADISSIEAALPEYCVEISARRGCGTCLDVG